ncbi:MAG: hypothetical protein ACREDJ_00310, partial [Methylocella sp.]
MPRTVFAEGSAMRHIIGMAAASFVGLMAIFAADLMSLLWETHRYRRIRNAGLVFDQHRPFDRDGALCTRLATQGAR